MLVLDVRLTRSLGGYLAVTDTPGVNADGTPIISDLQSQCAVIGNAAECWVSAVNGQFNDSITTRPQLFYEHCTEYGCYMETGFNTPGFYFYANNTLYQNPVVGGQNAIGSLVSAISTSASRFSNYNNLWWYDQLGGSDSVYPVDMQFWDANGCHVDIFVDYRPTQAPLAQTFLYGEVIPLCSGSPYDCGVNGRLTSHTPYFPTHCANVNYPPFVGNTWQHITVYQATSNPVAGNLPDGFATIYGFNSMSGGQAYEIGTFYNEGTLQSLAPSNNQQIDRSTFYLSNFKGGAFYLCQSMYELTRNRYFTKLHCRFTFCPGSMSTLCIFDYAKSS